MSSFSIPTIASLKNAVDELRVQYYPKNETERRVYEALSSKNWGASTTLLGEIATDSYEYEKYGMIMTIVWEMIDSPGSSWKQIFKALSLLEFLVKNGAERVVEDCRDKMRTLRRLQEYNYFEGTADKGSGVREKSKQLIDLLGSNESIRNEREKAKRLRNKFTGVGSDGGGSYGGSGGGSSYGGNDSGRYDSGRYDSGKYDNGRYDSGGSNRRESYSGSSGSNDRYRDENRESRRASESSTYGGGSYETERRGRYSDEPRDTDNYANERSDDNNNNYSYNSKSTSSSSSTKKNTSSTSSSSNSSGGKFKVSIKNEPTSKVTTSQQNTAQVDFFGTESAVDAFSSAPATSSASTFDAFGTHHSSNDGFNAFQSAPVASSHNSFDAFSTPVAHTAPQNHVFDAFSTPAQPTQSFAPPAQNHIFDAFSTPAAPTQSFPPPSYPPQNQSFGNFQSAPPQQQQQFNGFSNVPVQQNFAPQPPQQQFQQQHNHNHDDFGDFEGASAPAPKPVDKWASLGGLVNLSDLNATTTKKESAPLGQSNQNHTAFVGLDGFSQPRQSMNSGPSLSSGLNSNVRPMGAPMGGAPLGGGMGAPMGRPGPMGGPMMGPGGYPPQVPGGFPPQNGFPSQPGYPNQGGGFPQQGGYLPQVPGGFPPQGGYPQPGYPVQGGGFPPQGGYPQQFSGF